MLLEKKILTFGPFHLDPAERRLWRGSEPVELKPKVFDTLCYLVSNPGRVLPKEEIMGAIWPDRFVSAANLMQNVFLLRRALGESESGTKYIANFHGRGYQFLVPVETRDPIQVAAPDPEVPRQPVNTARGPQRRLLILAAAATLGGACVLFLQTGHPRQPATGMIRRIPLTRLPGAEYEPALSRDGSKVAFVWRPQGGGATSLFVLRSGSDEPKRLWPEPADCSSPAWSPDGRYLAYLRQDGTRMQVMIRPEEEKGEPRMLTELFPSRYGLNGRRLDWSPDGRWLAVDDKIPDHPFGIYLIDLATGHRTLATAPTPGTIGAMYPRFSPDGKSVAFILLESWFQHDLQVTDLATGATRTLTDRRRQISDHDWSPDGKAVYVAINEDGEYRIWKASVGPGSPARLQPTAMAGPVSIQFSVSRLDGQMVASELTQDLNVWRLDLHPPPRGKQWTPVVASTAADLLPQISPDGTRLCFLSDRTGDQQLWVSNADGSGSRQLTRQDLRPVVGQWSPDGRKIIFHDLATLAIYQISAAGGVPERLAGAGTGGHPIYNSDGSGFFYARGPELRFRKFGDRSDLLLSLSKDGATRKVVSRDGRFLYFSANYESPCIYRLDIATGKTTRIVDDLLIGYWGAWTAGSTGLYYLASDPVRPTRAVIRFRDFATGRTRILAPFEGLLPPLGTSLWSLTPDERSLYVVRLDGSEADLVRVPKLPSSTQAAANVPSG